MQINAICEFYIRNFGHHILSYIWAREPESCLGEGIITESQSFELFRNGLLEIVALREPPIHVKLYYNYCLRSLLELGTELSTPITLILAVSPGDEYAELDKSIPVVLLQVEHTIVAPGGRDLADAPLGEIPLKNKVGRYHARLAGDLSLIKRATAIIEYSQPNISNIQNSPLASLYRNRVFYIAPLIGDPTTSWPARVFASNKILTIMTPPKKGDRRESLIKELNGAGHNFRNISDNFENLSSVYKRHKILLNTNQTDHHHTFSELRILPALLAGMLIVAEETPLLNLVRYESLLLTGEASELGNLLRDARENYRDLRSSLISRTSVSQVFEELKKENAQAFRAIVRSVSGKH